jgi:hypothetical protein
VIRQPVMADEATASIPSLGFSTLAVTVKVRPRRLSSVAAGHQERARTAETSSSVTGDLVTTSPVCSAVGLWSAIDDCLDFAYPDCGD